MTGDRIGVKVLCARTIANLSPQLASALELPGEQRSIALLSTDCDDVTYIALDEATKAARVEVTYARSLYAGAANASTANAGEVIGILCGPDPAEVESGLRAALRLIESGLSFRSAREDDKVVYLAHCVSRSGSYLSKQAHIPQGEALAYLIAPPVEAILGLDRALKAADVRLCEFYAPPTETNFAGGLLTGSESACRFACRAFSQAVLDCANQPQEARYGT